LVLIILYLQLNIKDSLQLVGEMPIHHHALMRVLSWQGNYKMVIIDTVSLVAFCDVNDKWHNRTVDIFSKLKAVKFIPLYFDCVMNETISVLARRTEEQKRANDFQPALTRLLERVPEDMIEWVSKEIQRLYQEVVSLVCDSGGVLNFHDALIAIRAKELNIKYIFSFDKDFDQLPWLTRIADVDNIPLKRVKQNISSNNGTL